MYKKLKKYFPSLQSYETIPSELDSDFTWFMAENGRIVGINTEELTDKDEALLTMFLEPFDDVFPQITEEEKKWRKFVQTKEDHMDVDMQVDFRFIYFRIPSELLTPLSFKSALNQLFQKETIILWESKTDGVIVDMQQDELKEFISFNEIIDILISDLYSKVRFFVGPYLSSLEQVKNYYDRIIEQADVALSYSENNVVSYLEAIPYFIIEQIQPELKEELLNVTLKEFQDDGEFIRMVEVLLKNDLNISVAAKKLYLHRNSLLYRVEKFAEKTGLDIRKFHDALIVYFVLLANKNLS